MRPSSDSALRICRELEHATLKLMVPITDSLALRAAGDEPETSSAAVKTRLFYRYYAHLIKIMERSHMSEVSSSVSSTTLLLMIRMIR